MYHGLLQIGGLIDLDRLEKERRGELTPPPERKATEAQRNDAAVQDKFFNVQIPGQPPHVPIVGDYPQVASSVEEHLKSKGLTEGQISEHLLDLARHEDEKDKPGPDLTYFSEWENAVGLRHPHIETTTKHVIHLWVDVKHDPLIDKTDHNKVVAWHRVVKDNRWEPIRHISVKSPRSGNYDRELIIDDNDQYWRWTADLEAEYGGHWSLVSKFDLYGEGWIKTTLEPGDFEDGFGATIVGPGQLPQGLPLLVNNTRKVSRDPYYNFHPSDCICMSCEARRP